MRRVHCGYNRLIIALRSKLSHAYYGAAQVELRNFGEVEIASGQSLLLPPSVLVLSLDVSSG